MNKGFSLVELIVVIAIMAVLAGVAVPVYSAYTESAKKGVDEDYVAEIYHAGEIKAALTGVEFDGVNVTAAGVWTFYKTTGSTNTAVALDISDVMTAKALQSNAYKTTGCNYDGEYDDELVTITPAA